MKNTGAYAYGCGWFEGRRDHFVRRALGDFFLLASGMQALFAEDLACSPLGEKNEIDPARESGETWTRMHRCLAEIVGTERDPGPLWQLKDLCHRIWPQEKRERHRLGVLVDWLMGSLFHEAMKLKEDLYLLATYGPAALALGRIEESGTGPDAAPAGRADMPALMVCTAAPIHGQLERMGALLARISRILRQMLPELAANPLVLRLLAEREQSVAGLWGENLEELFSAMFSGRAADGFCLAGASYLRGHWQQQALAMYQRALTQDPDCDEAIVRIAHIEATLRASAGASEH